MDVVLAVVAAFAAAAVVGIVFSEILDGDRQDAERRNKEPNVVDFTPRKGRGRIEDERRPNNKGW